MSELNQLFSQIDERRKVISCYSAADLPGGEGGQEATPGYICYTGMCRWIWYGFQSYLSSTGYTMHVFVSQTGYSFPKFRASPLE